MSDVVPDDSSQSVDVLDEDTLLPLSESAGVKGDDPAAETESAEYPNQGKVDKFELEPDEEPGVETRPDEDVRSPEEDD
jgi:hypothetical protein